MQDKFKKFLFPTEDESFLKDTEINTEFNQFNQSESPKLTVTEHPKSTSFSANNYSQSNYNDNQYNQNSYSQNNYNQNSSMGYRSQPNFNQNRPQPSNNNEVFNPMQFKDSVEIAQEILKGSNVIVNFETLLRTENGNKVAMRIIDYLCGVCFACNMQVKRINDDTFMFLK